MLSLRPSNRCILFSLALLGLSVSSVNAAILTVVGGELQGATNVLVSGSFYDVSFQDGSCDSLYSGCNEASDFTFQAADDADAASQALIDQIFNSNGSYDTNPELTRGIENINLGAIETAYWNTARGGINWDQAVNYAGSTADLNGCESVSGNKAICVRRTSFDYTLWDDATYAVWSNARPAPVPEPAILGLFALGLFGLSAARRRITT